jgi:anti-sigma B factor antagonist
MAVTAPQAERSIRVHGLGMKCTRKGDDQVIALDGELDMASAGPIENELLRAVSGDCGRVVVDLRELRFLDSTGVHLLANAYARCAHEGTTMKVLVGNGAVRRVLEVCGMVERLACAEDEAPL